MLPVICVNKMWRTWRSLFDRVKSRPHCYSGRVVHTVLFWPCCPHCVVLTVLSTLLFWPCCPHCCSDRVVHTVVLTVFSTLCCSDRVVHTCSDRVVHTVDLTVLSTLCCSDRVVHTVLFWPCCSHCVVLTVMSIQGYKYIPSTVTLKSTQEFVLVTLHSHCALTIRQNLTISHA